MKKSLLVLSLLLVFVSLRHPSVAQIQGVNLNAAGDSSWSATCSVPDTVSFYIYGSAGGYLPTDSILLEVFFGDGTSVSYNTPIWQNSYFFDGNLEHVYTLPGNYQVMFIATGPDGDSDTLIDQSVLIANGCGNASGVVYLDGNNNCVYDFGETLLPNIPVQITTGGNFITWAYTDSLGYYNISLGNGFTYELTPITSMAPVTCPAGGSYTVSNLPAFNLNFGLSCQPDFDYTITVTNQGYRPNQNTNTWINPRNLILSCNAPASQVNITLDPALTFVSASVTPSAINGQQITFNPGALLSYGFSQSFYITTFTAPTANIGDTLCIQVSVDPVTGDADPSNNALTNCMPVRNSYDPNEKQESFAGTGTANILPGTILDYTIHFQNLGNDDAIDIYIIDTLDASLEPSSFQFISSSHEPVITFHQNNIVRFEFKNIYLPAASVNEPASHGYVNYKIYAPQFLPNGTQIQNTAHIFFDFNPAIVTNTVTHIIDLTSGIHTPEESAIQFYPNPAVNELHIQQDDAQETRLEIFDMTGKRVLFSTVKGSGSIEVSQLAKGSYILTVTGDRHSRSMKLIVQ